MHGYGHNSKRGVLGTGTSRKKGGGGSRNGHNSEKDDFKTGLVQKYQSILAIDCYLFKLN